MIGQDKEGKFYFMFPSDLFVRSDDYSKGVFLQDSIGRVVTREEWDRLCVMVNRFFEYHGPDIAESMNDDTEEVKNKSVSGNNNREKDRSGFVYFLKADNNLVKIGKTKRLDERIHHFSVKLPYQTQLIHSISTSNMDQLERHFHKVFVQKRKHGEWFELSEEDITSIKQNFSASS